MLALGLPHAQVHLLLSLGVDSTADDYHGVFVETLLPAFLLDSVDHVVGLVAGVFHSLDVAVEISREYFVHLFTLHPRGHKDLL